MYFRLPDPFPGRCLNNRQGQRCLDRDGHNSKCQFPGPSPLPGVHEHSVQTYTYQQPEPWIPPWEREENNAALP